VRAPWRYAQRGFARAHDTKHTLKAPALTPLACAAPEQEAEIHRLSTRYFVDRVFNRAQILERCRRVYELDPKDALNPAQEVMDLMLCEFTLARPV
jgi:hypothetical protein